MSFGVGGKVRPAASNGLAATRRFWHWLHDRRAAVALMFALTTPLLLASTGLSVDVGVWYQNQVALQSAADSAALASAMNDDRVGATTASDKVDGVEQIAAAAADGATNSQFNFAPNNTNSNTNPYISVSCCTSTVPQSVGAYDITTSYTATVHAPRTGFFSHIEGMGLTGLSNGTQYASATALISHYSIVSGGSCLSVNPEYNSLSPITFVNDNGGGKSGGISAKNCTIQVNCGNGNTAFNPPNSNNSDILAQAILVGAANGCTIGYGSNLQTTSDGGDTVTSCTSSTSGCNLGTSPLATPDPLGAMGDALGDQSSGSAAWQAACTAAGLTSTSTSPVDLYAYFSSHTYSYNGTSYTINPSTYCEPSAASSSATFSQGTYFFPYGYHPTGSVTFGPGIYYFGGNLSTQAGNTLASNGATLVFVGSATIDMAGNSGKTDKVALVAPDPSLGDSCLDPLKYNNASTPFTDATTLDGTNGGGICGVAIYQGRNDTASMRLVGDTASTIIGIIYVPSAQLTLSGNGGFSAGVYSSGSLNTQTGTLAISANNVVLNGNGALGLNINTSDNAGQLLSQLTTTSATYPPWLVK